MESKVEYDVRMEGEQFVFQQIVTKIMPVDMAVLELRKVQQQLEQLDKQTGDLKVAIEKNQFETDYKKISKEAISFRELKEKWAQIVAPAIMAKKKVMEEQIKEKKATEKYDKITDKNQKIVVRNTILGEICNDLDIDRASDTAREVAARFEKL